MQFSRETCTEEKSEEEEEEEEEEKKLFDAGSEAPRQCTIDRR
jgi:hypothetical protein